VPPPRPDAAGAAALKPPVSLRDTVLLFGRLGQDGDIAALFSRVAWQGVSRRQLVHAFLDRPPSPDEAIEPPDFDPGAAAMALFLSHAFRDGLVRRVLDSFPGKRRLLFAHVQKAAGSDFIAAVQKTMPRLEHDVASAEAMPAPLLAQRLRRFANQIPQTDTIFVGGHIPLREFLDAPLFRFCDRLATTVRHPHEICVSLANYIVKRFQNTPDLSAGDVRSWADALGLTAAEIAAQPPHVLALRLATVPGIRPVNPICSMLGDGTAAGTFAMLSRAAVEITEVGRYSAWLRQVWRIERDVQANASPRLIAWDDLSTWQKGLIEAECSEDRIVYAAIMACLDESGGLSVTGPEVARRALR